MKKTFIRDIKRDINGWSILGIIGVAIILLPNFNIVTHLFTKANENFKHIQEYLLKDYIINSLILVFFTGIITAIIGIGLAWLIVAYDFPLKRYLKWGLILPLAIPSNIAAYTYNGIVGYTGIIQKTLRDLNINYNPESFDIMTIWGAIFIFSITLYPYVYMVTKSFLEKQSSSLVENARVLGVGPLKLFFKVVLPISRGALVGGVSLVALEVLNDFGVVQYYGINTFSTAIFKTWFGMYDLESATKLAGILMAIVIILLGLEKGLRGRKRFSLATSKERPLKPKRLKGLNAFLASTFTGVVFLISFLIPFVQLLVWAIKNYSHVLDSSFLKIIGDTVFVSLISAIIIVVLSLIIGNTYRLCKSKGLKAYTKLANIGYSIPGTVIAIGVLTVFIGLDKLIFGSGSKLVLSSSIWMLVFAFVIRYLSIGFNNIESGFLKIGSNYVNASRLLGYGITKTFFKVDLKMMKGPIISAVVLAFIDIMKELPLTLILRPFNFNTLATKTYQYATDEVIQFAAVPAIIIIFISMIAIFIFKVIGEGKKKNAR